MRMLGDRIAIRVVAAQQTSAAGLYLAPTSDNEQIGGGEVVAAGPDVATVAVGDTVYFNRFTASKVKSKKLGEVFVIRVEEVLGVE